MSDVLVTGIGIISSIGDSLSKNRESLRQGSCRIGKSKYIDSNYATTLPFGEIPLSNEELTKNVSFPTKGVTRTSLLAYHAFMEGLIDSGWSKEKLTSSGTALIVGNTVGGMCLTDEMYLVANHQKENSDYLSSFDCGSVTIFLQHTFGIKGIINTINTACSSSANAIMYGARLIKHGLAERVIVGGVDSLSKFTINGFNSLMILSDSVCRPFDANRNGLNLGEAAGFLFMEKKEHVNRKSYGILSGYANANDAYHPSTLSPTGDGPTKVMKEAMDIAQIYPDQIGYINTHGTATVNNDEVESVAMKNIFFNKVPLFNSTKSYTGHTLGAAGAIGAIYSLLSLYHQEVYPSLQFESPILETGLIPVTEFTSVKMSHVLSNSFGFGGNCSSLVFSNQ